MDDKKVSSDRERTSDRGCAKDTPKETKVIDACGYFVRANMLMRIERILHRENSTPEERRQFNWFKYKVIRSSPSIWPASKWRLFS